MLNCREATVLISQGQDRSLEPMERLTLRVHIWMCSTCRQFERQMRLFRRACDLLAHADDPVMNAPGLPLEAYERIRSNLPGRKSE